MIEELSETSDNRPYLIVLIKSPQIYFKTKKLQTSTIFQILLKQLQQNVSKLSEETTIYPQGITITDDSNIVQIPVHNIRLQLKNSNHNKLSNEIMILLSAFTIFSLTTPHNSPQPGSPNTQTTNTVQFQTTTPTTQPKVPILAYTPAQTTQTQSMQPMITMMTLQSNPLPNYTTSRHLSRPPLQTIPTNPLSHSLISKNPYNTQPTIRNNSQLNTLNPSSTSQQSNTSRRFQNTQFQISNPPSTTIRNNTYINAKYTQPILNPSNIPSNVSNKTT